MEEVEVGTNQPSKKRTKFLTVLIVLTWIWTGMAIMTSMTAFMNGPLDDDQLKAKELSAAKTMKEQKEKGNEQFNYGIEIGLERMYYINKNAFVQNYSIVLVISLLGAFSGYMMWNRRKLGFHLYILYTLLSTVMPYLIFPASMVINAEIYSFLFLGGLFVLLYSRNLHVME